MSRTIALAVLALTLALDGLTFGNAALAGPNNRERRGGAEMLNKDYYTHNRYYRRDNPREDDLSRSPSAERRSGHQDGVALDATRQPSLIVTSDRVQGIRR